MKIDNDFDQSCYSLIIIMDLVYRVLLQNTIVKVQHGKLKLGINQTYFKKLMPIFSQLIFP